MPISTNMTEH